MDGGYQREDHGKECVLGGRWGGNDVDNNPEVYSDWRMLHNELDFGFQNCLQRIPDEIIWPLCGSHAFIGLSAFSRVRQRGWTKVRQKM